MHWKKKLIQRKNFLTKKIILKIFFAFNQAKKFLNLMKLLLLLIKIKIKIKNFQ